MTVKQPERDRPSWIRGGSDAWDTTQAGALLVDDYFDAPAVSGVTANLAATDAADTLASSATVAAASGVTCTLAVTDAADTLVATAGAVVSAGAAATDSADTLAGSAGVRIGTSLARTDAADTLAAGAGIVVAAGASTTDSADTLAGDATVQQPAGVVSCSLDVADQPDTLLADAAVQQAEQPQQSLGGRDKMRLFDVPFRRVHVSANMRDDDDMLQAVAAVDRIVAAALSATDESDILVASAWAQWPEVQMVIAKARLVRSPQVALIRSKYEAAT